MEKIDNATILSAMEKQSDEDLIKLFDQLSIDIQTWRKLISKELAAGEYTRVWLTVGGLTKGSPLMLITKNNYCVNIEDMDTISMHLYEFEEERILNPDDEQRKVDFAEAEQLFLNVAEKYRNQEIKKYRESIEELRESISNPNNTPESSELYPDITDTLHKNLFEL